MRKLYSHEEIVPAPPASDDASAPIVKDTYIVRAAIHPGIGIARVGNSTAELDYYIGPEVVEPPPMPKDVIRDPTGAIRRQAARFRIYGYNAAGEVVREITAEDAEITWTGHVVNRKAQWYQFQAAMDIPEAVTLSVPLRNPDVKGAYRDELAIDPGPRTITGTNTSGPDYEFTGGTFMGTSVPLGELRTDEAGCLLVLGGVGYSSSPEGKPVYRPADPNSFNNADGWFDDMSDGPISATLSLDGRDLPVESSWVICAPPNYAPDVVGWRTLYDLLIDTYIKSGWMPYPDVVSFRNDVLPAVQRLSNLQWVNKGFATMFGRGCPMDFEDPAFIAKLAYRPASASDPDPYAELRQQVFNSFRAADNAVYDRATWPWIYGDAFGSFADNDPNNNLSLSDVRSQLLEAWVEGKFINDWDPTARPYRTIDAVPLAEQPAMLDRAALHFCLADAFHPGCEATWPMRHASLYSAPFRIRRRAEGAQAPDYGTKLTQEIVLQPGGPLYAQGPGDITKWMGLPWQGDTAFCRSGYEPAYDPYLPTFWSARVPNQVLTEEDYLIAVDEGATREERIAAFNSRASWLRSLSGSVPEQMMQMIATFGALGIVEARPGLKDDPDIPEVIFVESLPEETAQKVKAKANALLKAVSRGERPERRSRVEQAGWESAEQLEEFRRARGL